ncbi:MAG: glycosyltransferase [Gammaproteobacteria bacterium]|nr:glycosyltransferase [Gammaproteobacteria bacterium]
MTDDHSLVSIILPTLNSIKYLEGRVASILDQTHDNYEVLVVDSHSDDGTWEYMTSIARSDSRFKLLRMARLGIYPAINFAIERANGGYLYVATSDDVMENECINVMYRELTQHPDCDVCHARCNAIDSNSRVIPNWWESRHTTKFFGDLFDEKHIRYAPYDVLIHLSLSMVYYSLTQLLIRHTVIDKAGAFKNDWGPASDFEWGIRVALNCNIVFTPECLSSWRIHDNQATTAPDYSQRLEMARAGISNFESKYPEIAEKIDWSTILYQYKKGLFKDKIVSIAERKGLNPRTLALGLTTPRILYDLSLYLLGIRDFKNVSFTIRMLREKLEQLNLTDNIRVI